MNNIDQQSQKYERINRADKLHSNQNSFGERTLFEYANDDVITSFYFMPVKVYYEAGQRFTQLVVAFISNNNIVVVSTVLGTEVARLRTDNAPIDFTTSITGEERFFGVLTETGVIHVYQFQLIDSKQRYLKYLKDLRAKTMSGNETEEELKMR